MANKDAQILTQRDLNRALLARQMLLERTKAPLPRVLERMGGIQAQYAPSMYIGLWSRVEDLERDAVTRGLERRSIVQGSMLRATIHLVAKGDYWPFVVGIRRSKREWWLRTHGRGVTAQKIAANDRKIRRALSDRPLRPRPSSRKRLASGPGVGLVDRPRARAAVGNLGASPRRPLRARRGLGRPGERERGGGDRAPRSPVPRRLRPGAGRGHRQLGEAQAAR